MIYYFINFKEKSFKTPADLNWGSVVHKTNTLAHLAMMIYKPINGRPIKAINYNTYCNRHIVTYAHEK